MYKAPVELQKFDRDINRDELRYHNRRVAVTKSFTFDAAHHLHCYEGKCKNLHGHTYKLVVTLSGRPDEIGMIIDFGDIKAIYQKAIKEKLDHQYLNDVLPPMNTTAENMIVWIWETLDAHLRGLEDSAPRGLRIEELSFFETPTSSATLKREWMVSNE